jgi:tetratricopeptide (TPR) repeat protein
MAIPKPGVQERILLHLRDYSDFSEAVEVPFSLSQMGIANAVAIARSNVPRAIAGLKDQGLLIERQAHVTGVSRKRKAYFLTKPGIALAEDTWKRLRSFHLRCIIHGGDIISTSLGEIQNTLPFSMRPVDVIRYLDDNGIIDIRSLSEDLIERDLSKHVEKQLVTSLGDLPRLRHFYGRQVELGMMADLLEARDDPSLAVRTIHVAGIAGIGKTTVASKLIERFMHRRNLLYHRCQDWEGARGFLDSVADWLASIGDGMLTDYLTSTPHPRPDDAAKILADALSIAPSLIVIDDYHKVSDKTLHQTIKAFALRIPKIDQDIGLVIFSRSHRVAIPTKDAEGNIISMPMVLTGLDVEASKHLLPAFEDLQKEQFMFIHSMARGHPLVLELINRGAPATAFHETLENYIAVEIFSKLSAEQKRLLGALAIYREAIPLAALAAQGLDTDELDSLVEQGLARQADADSYDVHDLIREFLHSGMEEDTRESLHKHAADWYSNKLSSAESIIEFLHHLIKCNQSERAADVVSQHGENLVRDGRMELLAILEAIDLQSVDEIHACKVRILQADILTLQGRFDEGQSLYEEALKHSKTLNDVAMEASVLASLADISLKRGDYEKSLKLHRQALEIFVSIEDGVGAARTYNNMGFIFRRKGDITSAKEAYSNVEEILTTEEDTELIHSRILLARSWLEMGEVEKARGHALKCHEETVSQPDKALHARARAVLGRFYAKTGDSELALHHYSEALEQMGQDGDPIALIETTLLLGEVLEDSERMEEALDIYREGLLIAEGNDLRMQIGELLARLGGAAPDMTRRMEYLQRALTVFRELGAEGRMREIQSMVHQAIIGR